MGSRIKPKTPLADARLAAIAANPDAAIHKSFLTSTDKGAVDEKARTVTFTITTGSVDRDNDTIDPAGWDVADYLRNPVVLWAHDYGQLPVARAIDIVPTGDGLRSTAQFPPKGVHQFADTVFDLIAGGYLNACSVGFKPSDYARAEDRDGIDFKRQGLLEWSIVPVPANADALVMARRAGINVDEVTMWARSVLKSVDSAVEAGRAVAHRGMSPKDVSSSKAPTGESWSAPSLSDMTPKGWGDLTDAEKRKIAGHFAWAAAMPPKSFGDLKLPHHNAKGSVVWNGVVAATARLNQSSIPSGDMGAVKAHLRRHYKQFGKPVPDALKATAEEVEKMAGATATALLTALDDHIDAADELMDNVLASLGIPDDDSDYGNGDMMQTPEDGGEPTSGGPGMKDVTNCPACLQPLNADGICPSCGWHSPDARPTDPDVEGPAIGVPVPSYASAADPVRWNRKLSKAFDVAGEPLEPHRLEYAWVSRYLETPIQELSVETFFVPSARMGSFLAALDDGLAAWHVDALRNITESGREVPPEYETLQLNSTNERSFMVAGVRFMRRPADNAKLVSKLERHWSGLHVVQYVRHEQAAVRSAWTQRVMTRAGELNYLRGEAFTLGGEFLDRGALDWDAMFLDAPKERVLRRAVDRLNEHGGDMESRGLLLMGPPGTGKTLSGRVMMRQADATFIWISARDFYRSGVFGAFTYAFDLAAECAPTILFFEDVDNWLSGESIDLLKTEMDGLKRNRGILTVLTTNFPELLPEALIDRPGRFHDVLEMALPTEGVRTRMLAAWLPDAAAASVARVAQQTDGYSGAHLRHLADFAKRLQEEEGCDVGAALTRALAKVQEQRDLIASLHDSDYRPRRFVRAAVGSAMGLVAKRGRVLSAANEGRLRTARENVESSITHMDAVLSQLARQPAPSDDDDDENDSAAAAASSVLMVQREETVPVLRLLADPEPTFDRDVVRAALRDAIQTSIAAEVREQTQLALARARGRVD